MQFFNESAVRLVADLRHSHETTATPIVLNGAIGPEGDGYNPESFMNAEQAEAYHRAQIETFARSQLDMVTAVTMTYAEEAIGITRAAVSAGIPVVISFTVETDGRLPSGMSLADAIRLTDRETGNAPLYYMINCAHPTHFQQVLEADGDWKTRIRGVRANASCKSHAELDEATELDDGDPKAFGGEYRELARVLPNLNVVGGCCGTDHRHIGEASHSLTTHGVAA